MTIIDLQTAALEPIQAFESIAASSAEIAAGAGEAHVHVVRIEAGGVIGPHEAGFGQFFLVVSGLGWAAGANGERWTLHAGQAAYIERGEMHSKGAQSDLVALMVQVGDLSLGGTKPPR